MAEDFFNDNRPMVTKDGKDLTSALEVFVNWCITEVQNKIQRSFHPSSSNRPLKKVVVTIQSLLATRPDPVLIGSLFAGSTEELEVLIKILSAGHGAVLYHGSSWGYVLRLAGSPHRSQALPREYASKFG